MLLYDLFSEYLENYRHSNNSKYNAERLIMKIKKYLKNEEISEINKNQIQDYVDYLYNTERLKKSYVYNIFQRIKAVFNYAIKRGYIKENPCKNVDVVKVKFIRRVDCLDYSRKNIREILKTFKKTFMYPLVYLDLHTGMRKGELVALDKEDFICKRILFWKIPVAILIANNDIYDMIEHEETLKLPKSNNVRIISLDFKCSIFTYRLLKKKDSKLFDYSTNYITDSFNEIVKSNPKLKGIRLQDLRHLHACYLLSKLRNKANCIKIVQERLGHSNVLQSFNTYAHVIHKDEQKAIKCLNFM